MVRPVSPARSDSLTKALAMDQPDTLREAVGVFTSADDLQEAIDELQSSGFHRAELSLLANEEAVNEKLGGGFDEAPGGYDLYESSSKLDVHVFIA